jgi:hypothetical protein
MARMHRPSRLSWWLLPAVLGAWLSACATLPREVDVSRQQLEAALARRFPYEARAGGLFSARAGVPHLELLPQSNRLRLAFGVDATERLTRSTVHADLALSFGLRYEPADASIRAADVRVEELALQGLPEGGREVLRMAGGLMAEQLLENAVLHTFRPEDLAKAQGLRPGSLRVTPNGVRMELVPASP